jgi:hypothetical protein
MTSAQLAPALIVPFVVWRVYRRVRRNIGPQKWQPGRLVGRAIFFGVISGLIALAVAAHPPVLMGLVGGLALGLPLAWWGVELTRFETTAEGKFYTPNTWIGLGVTLLLVGRLVYRLTALLGAAPVSGPMPPDLFKSPLTLVMFGLTAGYYVAYSAGVVMRGKKLAM